MKYRKRPIEIEAVIYSKEKLSDILEFVPHNLINYVPESDEYYIRTLEGYCKCIEGDYIVRGMAGEFYPCRPEIFLASHDIVDQAEEDADMDYCVQLYDQAINDPTNTPSMFVVGNYDVRNDILYVGIGDESNSIACEQDNGLVVFRDQENRGITKFLVYDYMKTRP